MSASIVDRNVKKSEMTITQQVFASRNIFFNEDAVHYVMIHRTIVLSQEDLGNLTESLGNLTFSDQWAVDQNISNCG